MEKLADQIFNIEERSLIGPDHEKADLICQSLSAGIGKSNWVARAGMVSKFYFNMDKIYGDPDLDKDVIRAFHDEVAIQIGDLLRKTGATCVGFTSPRHGPIGVVQLRGALAERLTEPTFVVRLNERLTRNQIWFEQGSSTQLPVTHGSRVLLFCSAATTGSSLYRGALILRKFGAECQDAFVLFDRQQGATRQLALNNVRLHSLTNKSFLQAKEILGSDDVEIDQSVSRLDFESIGAIA